MTNLESSGVRGADTLACADTNEASTFYEPLKYAAGILLAALQAFVVGIGLWVLKKVGRIPVIEEKIGKLEKSEEDAKGLGSAVRGGDESVKQYVDNETNKIWTSLEAFKAETTQLRHDFRGEMQEYVMSSIENVDRGIAELKTDFRMMSAKVEQALVKDGELFGRLSSSDAMLSQIVKMLGERK